MRKVVEIIKRIADTTSTNDKVKIIKENKDNEIFVKVLQYAYNDNNYGFSLDKLIEGLNNYDNSVDITWEDTFDMLDKLAASNINDNLRDCVYAHLMTKDEEVRDLIIKILSKDLRANISAKTINKAIKGCIFEWNVQQSYPINKYPLKPNTPIVISEKLNGINCAYYKGNMVSRQGKVINGLNHIIEQLESLGLSNFMVNGELVRENKEGLTNGENFRETTSIVNSDNDKSNINFVIFDLVPNDEFVIGESQLPYIDRLEQMNDIKTKLNNNTKNIEITPIYYIGNDITEVDKWLDYANNNDIEGVMVIKQNSLYKTKRHSGILKAKSFSDEEFEIVGIEEGSGRLQGLLGAIQIKFKDNIVSVGSGFSDKQRKELFTKDIIGKKATVRYKEITKDKKTGLESLQFPTFVNIREML